MVVCAEDDVVVGGVGRTSSVLSHAWIVAHGSILSLERLGLNKSVVVRVVLTELRYSEVECDDLGRAFPGSDLDEVMHEEARLDEGIGLAEANCCELSDDY